MAAAFKIEFPACNLVESIVFAWAQPCASLSAPPLSSQPLFPVHVQRVLGVRRVCLSLSFPLPLFLAGHTSLFMKMWPICWLFVNTSRHLQPPTTPRSITHLCHPLPFADYLLTYDTHSDCLRLFSNNAKWSQTEQSLSIWNYIQAMLDFCFII